MSEDHDGDYYIEVEEMLTQSDEPDDSDMAKTAVDNYAISAKEYEILYEDEYYEPYDEDLYMMDNDLWNNIHFDDPEAFSV